MTDFLYEKTPKTKTNFLKCYLLKDQLVYRWEPRVRYDAKFTMTEALNYVQTALDMIVDHLKHDFELDTSVVNDFLLELFNDLKRFFGAWAQLLMLFEIKDNYFQLKSNKLSAICFLNSFFFKLMLNSGEGSFHQFFIWEYVFSIYLTVMVTNSFFLFNSEALWQRKITTVHT